jgi:hypothetical protein
MLQRAQKRVEVAVSTLGDPSRLHREVEGSLYFCFLLLTDGRYAFWLEMTGKVLVVAFLQTRCVEATGDAEACAELFGTLEAKVVVLVA